MNSNLPTYFKRFSIFSRPIRSIFWFCFSQKCLKSWDFVPLLIQSTNRSSIITFYRIWSTFYAWGVIIQNFCTNNCFATFQNHLQLVCNWEYLAFIEAFTERGGINGTISLGNFQLKSIFPLLVAVFVMINLVGKRQPLECELCRS